MVQFRMYKTIKSLFLVFALIICMGASPSGSPVGGVSGSPADLPSLVRDLLDDGIINQSPGGGGNPLEITGLRIEIVANSDWIGVHERGLDIFNTSVDIGDLTKVTHFNGNDFTDIVAGEYTSGSGYNNTTVIGSLAESGSLFHWNQSSGVTLNLYAKFNSTITLDKVEINMHGGYTFPSDVNFYDQDNNELTPATAPTGWGDAVEVGSPVAACDRMRWTF